MNAATLVAVTIAAIGWALLQFVWQASVVGLAYAVARWLLPRGNPRYLAALLALLALAVWPAVTVWHELAAGLSTVSLSAVVVSAATQSATGLPVAASPAWQVWVHAAAPWLVLAWALGVAVLGTRVVRQWLGLRAMLRAAEALPVWQARARRFANGLGLRRMVPVLASVRIVTPTLVGWVRPAVVLPLAVLARMPAVQIDLILAHELAHLKRLDHIANLCQVVLETLLFYHPVVHWISRDARNERELCCDALALRVTQGQRRDFVAALANLEEFRTGRVELALAASGGVLVERAWFIAGAQPAAPRPARGNLLVAVAAVALVGLAWMGWQRVAQQADTLAWVGASDRALVQATPVPLQWAEAALDAPALAPVLPAVLVPATVTPLPPAALQPLDPPSLRLPVTPLHVTPVLALSSSSHALAPAPASAGAATLPRATHTVRPLYPPTELLAGTQARIVVEFSLDARGVPQHLTALGTSTGPFAVAALQALRQWRFVAPAPAGHRYKQAFAFVLGADAGASPAAARPCMVTTGTHICRPVTELGAGVTAFKSLH